MASSSNDTTDQRANTDTPQFPEIIDNAQAAVGEEHVSSIGVKPIGGKDLISNKVVIIIRGDRLEDDIVLVSRNEA